MGNDFGRNPKTRLTFFVGRRTAAPTLTFVPRGAVGSGGDRPAKSPTRSKGYARDGSGSSWDSDFAPLHA